VSKFHTIYILVDADGRFINAYLSYSAAVRDQLPGYRIRELAREDY